MKDINAKKNKKGYSFSLRCKEIFFAFGLLVIIVSFYVDNVNFFPCVQKLLTPKYVAAMKGYNSLKKDQPLIEGDGGFEELQQLFRDKLYFTDRAGNRVETAYNIIRIEFVGSVLIASRLNSGSVERFTITTDLAEPFTTSEENFPAKIESYYAKNTLFRWKSIMFWTGIIIAGLAHFFIREKNDLARDHKAG